jgi:fermentation-respiration switch protein FrsA (DUF1100 family)
MLKIFLFLLILFLLILLVSFALFLFVFYVPPRKNQDPDKIDYPPGEIYEPFYDSMKEWILTARSTPHEDVSITSFDGLKLCGKYYEYAPGAPVELMFHGYRGSAERDMAGGMHRAFRLGHSALIVDQRCAGRSEGNVISFGVNEHRDCLAWVDFMLSHFGSDVKIILTGISMGASTVLMASDKNLPDNVVGILADCGFHSAREVICSVAKSMHVPSGLLYPFVKLGALLFGRFDLEELTAVDSVKNCRIPVLFFHGEEDDYVPSYMSRINYDACPSRKKLVLIPGAGHGLSFPVAPDLYVQEMRDFFHNEK